MSDTPRLMVPDPDHLPDVDYALRHRFIREATVPEVIAWLREHDAINYEAAARRIYGNALTPEDWNRVRAAVDAALPTEET